MRLLTTLLVVLALAGCSAAKVSTSAARGMSLDELQAAIEAGAYDDAGETEPRPMTHAEFQKARRANQSAAGAAQGTLCSYCKG